MGANVVVRALVAEDIARLHEIDTGFVSDAILQVHKTWQGLGAAWDVQEVTLPQPLDKPNGYDFTPDDLADIQHRLRKESTMQRVAEDAGRLVGLLEVEDQPWNRTAMVWNILIDRRYRRQGLGRYWMEGAAEWARERGCRALLLETQSNNINACRFYQRVGFRLTGIRDDLYHNDDLQRAEVAIFWSMTLDTSTGGSLIT